MRQITLSLITSVPVLLSAFAGSLANDTSAELSVGGLVFTQNADVSLESENLSISPNVVAVRYRFLNQNSAARYIDDRFSSAGYRLVGRGELRDSEQRSEKLP